MEARSRFALNAVVAALVFCAAVAPGAAADASSVGSNSRVPVGSNARVPVGSNVRVPVGSNVVIILADDLGFGEPSFQPRGAANNTNVTTPNIDALAASGTVFTNAYAGEAVCAPSRAALLTGLHTGHAYIRGNHGQGGHDLPLRATDTTVFELLRDSGGYDVICVGKWGLGWVTSSGNPIAKGCTSYFGVLDQNYAHNLYPAAPNFTIAMQTAANGSVVWEGLPFPANVNASRERCMAPGNTCVFAHDLWTNAALTEIASRGRAAAAAAAAGAPPPRPFLLYLAYTDPHAGGWSGTAEEGNPVPSDDGPGGRYANESAWPPNERDHASVIANFLDRDVGRVVAALADAGLTGTTLTLFASDNGASNEGGHDYAFFESSGPLRGFKRCLTEGGIRTPLIASMPGTLPPGGVVSTPVAFWDWHATLAEIGGVPPAPGVDGVSFAAQLAGGPPRPEQLRPLYFEFCTVPKPPPVADKKGWSVAVVNGTWKGVSFFSEDNAMALYDLATDEGETTDVGAAHPNIVAAFRDFARAAHVESALFPSGDAACVAS